MIDFIIHAVILATWLTYTFPPMANSKNKATQTVRSVAMVMLSFCIGLSFGNTLLAIL